MTIGCSIWMICLKLNWFFYGLSRMLQFSQFVWTPCYPVWDVFNNFLLIDETDRSKISSDKKRFFIALSLYPLLFFANTPFKRLLLSTVWFVYLQFIVRLQNRGREIERKCTFIRSFYKNYLSIECNLKHPQNQILNYSGLKIRLSGKKSRYITR